MRKLLLAPLLARLAGTAPASIALGPPQLAARGDGVEITGCGHPAGQGIVEAVAPRRAGGGRRPAPAPGAAPDRRPPVSLPVV